MRYQKIQISAILLFGIALAPVKAQTVSDIDGNVYKTIVIGTQTWMAENLRTTKYRNGDVIKTTAPPSKDIRGEFAPQYQWAYDGKESNVDIYGRLYTWFAATDSKGVCPIGWHVPTDADWSALITFLGGDILAYGRLKESGEIHWLKYDSGSNELGFTALPGGLRNSRGPFIDLNSSGNWWSATESGNYDAWYRFMNYDFNTVHRSVYLKRNGFSVRCVKN